LLNQQGGQVYNFQFTKEGTKGWRIWKSLLKIK
jgi:D-glycero-alpha-D-manno-heptose-7-phosphate kinase